ncbi:MAG: hypothetical protein GY756_04075 [bacterium]|nr:hypothetical protein [bacterium]
MKIFSIIYKLLSITIKNMCLCIKPRDLHRSESGFVGLVALIIAGGIVVAPFAPYIAYSPIYAGRAVYHTISGSWQLTETEYDMSFSTIWEGSKKTFVEPPYSEYLFYYEGGYVSQKNTCNISEEGTALYKSDEGKRVDEVIIFEKELLKNNKEKLICYSSEYVITPAKSQNNSSLLKKESSGYFKAAGNSFPY